jgi:hypothetical protein
MKGPLAFRQATNADAETRHSLVFVVPHRIVRSGMAPASERVVE